VTEGSRPRPYFQDQNQDKLTKYSVEDQDQDQYLLWCTLEADRKAFFIFGRKRNENESHLIILVFFSYIQSPSQPYNAPTILRPVSLLQLVLVDGIPLSSCTVYSIFVTFLDDISTRERFTFLVYCYWVKAIFHNLCTVLYWSLCGLTNSRHC